MRKIFMLPTGSVGLGAVGCLSKHPLKPYPTDNGHLAGQIQYYTFSGVKKGRPAPKMDDNFN